MAPKDVEKKPAVKATVTAKKPASSTTSSKPATKPASVKPIASSTVKKAPAGSAPLKKPAAVATAKKSDKSAKVAKEEPPAHEQMTVPEMTEEEKKKMIQEALAKADEETAELRKKAWQAQVEYDRRQEAKRRKKAEEETKRRKEEIALTKAMLEAAFDGEDEDLTKLLSKAKDIMKNALECHDSHGNTLLSEAAAGGNPLTVKLLLDRWANPNSQGEFQRTPLWRACFLGKEEVVMPLLEAGADPRISNEQGEMPLHISSVPSIKKILQEWDISLTEGLVAKWESKMEETKAAEAQQRAAAVRSAGDEVSAAKEDYDQAQKALKHARQELEKRIFEHDTCVVEKKADTLIEASLGQIHAAEATVEDAKKRTAAASERLDVARFALRENQAAEREAQGLEEDGMAPVGIPVEIKELDDVVIRDVGSKMKSDGRWPLVIDTSGQASVFLRYLDTNYVNILSSQNIEPNRLRRSILGGLRYGKPVVLDLMDVDLWPEMPRIFDAVHPGLLEALLTRSLLSNDGYKCLIRKEDGEEYEPNKFQDSRVAAFKLIILTASPRPNEDLVQRTYPLRVTVRG